MLQVKRKRKRKISLVGVDLNLLLTKGKAKQLGVKGKEAKLNFSYFICGEPHYGNECLKMEKLNVILVSNGNEEKVISHKPNVCVELLGGWAEGFSWEYNLVKHDLVRIDALRQGKLGVLDTLMCMRIKVNDKYVIDMLDLGATYIFIANRLLKELDLWLSNNRTTMKVVFKSVVAVIFQSIFRLKMY